MFDLIIKNGKLIDGSGNPWRYVDIGIIGDKIEKIGDLNSEFAKDVIDAKGKFVSPGFIDPHTHSDLIFALDKESQTNLMKGRITQGITTEVIGNCGLGITPLEEESKKVVFKYYSTFTPKGVNWNWSSHEDFLNYLEKNGVTSNVVTLLPHGAIRIAAMAMRGDAPTKQEMVKMKKLVEDGMEAGAFGMSTGLTYPPGVYSRTDEIIELAQVVSKYDGIYTSHIRGSSENLIPAVEELLKIGGEANIRVRHSHHGAVGSKYWSDLNQSIEMEEKAWDEEIICSFDIIPYNQVNPGLATIYPAWSKIGGRLLEHLRDQSTRKRLAHEIENVIATWPPWLKDGWPQNYVKVCGWNNIYIFNVSSNKNKQYENKSLMEYSKLVQKSPFDASADLMLEEEGEVTITLNVSGDETNDEPLTKLFRSPLGGPCSDAFDFGWNKPNPGAYAAFPRFLGRYIRDKKIVRIEEAIRKMTSLQAQMFGLRDRGMLIESMKADINVFDLSRVKDKATFDNPRQLSEGIDFVIINGKIAVREGEFQGQLFGKVLRRGR